MGNRIEHHYVPQFYLREFSTNPEKNEIGIYNLKNKFFFYEAPLRHQAKEKALYGKDDVLESRLSVLEGEVAPVIRMIIQQQELPSSETVEFEKLHLFLLFQYSRTLKAGENVNRHLDSMLSYTALPKSKLKIEPLKVTELMALAQTRMFLTQFLQMQILMNETSLPFITSDNPVALYNQLMEQKRALHPGNSLSWQGLQIFFPLSPRIVLFWSDPSVYKCGGKKKRSILKTSSAEDINQINALQYLNAHRQIFFNSMVKKGQIDSMINRHFQTRTSLTPKTFRFGTSVFSFGEDNRIGLKLSFVELNQAGRDFTLTNNLVYMRHPSFVEERQKERMRNGQ